MLIIYKPILALYGRKCIKILEPSSGGNGTKLNTPSPMFTEIAILKAVKIRYPTVVSTKPGANVTIANKIIVKTIAKIKVH